MHNLWTYYVYILVTWFWTSFFFRTKLVEMIFTCSDIVISEDIIKEIRKYKYSREKMESLELLRNFTSQIVFWFECDSRRKNIREIGGSRKIVRNIEFIRGRRKNIRSVHVHTEKKIEKRINRIRIVLSKIKKVSKWRREIRMAFFAKAIEKNNCVLYLQIQSLISCVYSSGFSLGNLHRLKRWSKNKKKKNKNSYEYFGRILRDRKQCSLIFSET